VELAVVFPVLLLLIIGVADYGRAFYTAITVSNAARAGAEYGARETSSINDTASMNAFAQVDGNDAGTLKLDAKNYCQCAAVTHACNSACPGGAAPDVFIEVTATKSMSTFFKYPGLSDTITISRKATFRKQ
jgi:Flp pilus assembly protein TadG